ncbi:glutamyl-tRNA reductase [Acidothermaceae bacterium B102]|nr:glutamyl-tRNA reductase [Acidothermaceae bacterium B102]
MSVLVVGISHRTAPVPLLERVAVPSEQVVTMLEALLESEHVHEALLLSTCNRVEVYAEVDKFHGGVQDVSEILSAVTGVPRETLAGHLYVHYEDAAVQHLFTVACGLDSMVVGEAQILGQLRAGFRTAQGQTTTGRVLNELVRQALRVGKRAHSETGIDRAGQSLVSVGLDLAESEVGDVSGRTALVVGAGSMAALAAATLRRRGAGRILVANRTLAHAVRTAESVGGEAFPLEQLREAIALSDLVVAATGSVGAVVHVDAVAPTIGAPHRQGRPLFFLDLALPRDVEHAVGELDGVLVADLESLRDVLESAQVGEDVEAVRRIVADEVATFLAWQRSVQVAPTVVALRTKAELVVAAELSRLRGRVELDDRTETEVAATVRRVVDKILHAPTVRVKQLADVPGGAKYAEALRELFELDPGAPDAVSRAAVEVNAEELS